MKNKILAYLFLAFWFIIPISCQKNNDLDLLGDSLSIESAQKWFNKTLKSSRVSNENNPKAAIWSKAGYYNFSFGKAVVVPINYEQSVYPNYSINQKDSKNVKTEPKYKLSNNNLDYLVIYKDKNNIFQERIYSFIPDADYLEISDGRKKKIPYSGLILINNWNNKFITGYKYVGGKVISIIKNTSRARTSDYTCETTDWFSCGSGDGGSTWHCSYTHSDTYCYETGGGWSPPNEDYPNPEFPNGSGGGGGDITIDYATFNQDISCTSFLFTQTSSNWQEAGVRGFYIKISYLDGTGRSTMKYDIPGQIVIGMPITRANNDFIPLGAAAEKAAEVVDLAGDLTFQAFKNLQGPFAAYEIERAFRANLQIAARYYNVNVSTNGSVSPDILIKQSEFTILGTGNCN